MCVRSCCRIHGRHVGEAFLTEATETVRSVSFYIFHYNKVGDLLHHATNRGIIFVLYGLVQSLEPQGPEGAPLVLGMPDAAFLECYFDS